MNKIDLVHAILKEMIVAGDLPPGAPIDKAALAQRLGASRQPVSAAIDRLAFEGLVDVIPQHGSFVSKLDPERVADWFLIRAGIEAEFAARLAADAPKGTLTALRRNLKEQGAAQEAGNLAALHDLDLDFHQTITGHIASPEAQAILTRAEANLGRLRRLLLPEPGRAERTVAEHRAIYEALAAGEPEASARAMRAHIGTVAQLFQRHAATLAAMAAGRGPRA